MAGMALPLCLILAVALQGGLTRAPGPLARPGPLLLRLRRLEEQFLRLQEVTLNHLQSIASNYNISYNIDGRFQALAEQAEAADAARAALGAELARLATAGRRLRRRLKRLEGTGQHRFYVDRRLLAAGSGFQQGYEIPTGGSLVLGWRQDGPKTDLGTAEAFVGHLAGFAVWRRALLPGEVARMATGRGMPRGPLLTLADASLQGGVRRVPCPCLQRCL
ncbi:hypothetical protein DUI87_05498 [Hirundo rustica rustica]|uniref:Pentraxin n=1 Tax=Hirundo rustica rustica TaxID=333673 RepID=A0A3M0KYQ7_HIRRU|nr:hypothetical protein DUI87_05498 [Hirundo rustica rustica]